MESFTKVEKFVIICMLTFLFGMCFGLLGRWHEEAIQHLMTEHNMTRAQAELSIMREE